MSHAPTRKSHARRTTFVGLATASGVAIVFAALFTGAALSTYLGQIGWPFMVCFAAAVILVTTLVNPRGLFLTVVTAPILYVTALLATGWLITRGGSSAESGTAARANVLAIAYPVIEFFPVLAAVTLGSIVLALLRIALLTRRNAVTQRETVRRRVQQAESNRRTTRQSRRARERSNSVTVEELVRRRAQSGEPRRSLGDNLYG
ncbi:DUF6542 domain-containing protein, partial [Corynebacterium sp. LK2510]|uniref:DUF6542 domain-containing protein n=1 Tax=Corynebacterium sp. LK2510 TaxID=3110472 RepID=UPI0034CECA10